MVDVWVTMTELEGVFSGDLLAICAANMSGALALAGQN